MIRSRFQHSLVIQSVLHSYVVGFVLFYVTSLDDVTVVLHTHEDVESVEPTSPSKMGKE